MKTIKHAQFKPTQLTLTYGGGLGAVTKKGYDALLRQVATCMLWEPTFYASGDSIAYLIYEASKDCSLEQIAEIAQRARGEFKLRSVPLFLAVLMDERREENPSLVGDTIAAVIQRADELAEFLALHAKLFGYETNDIKGHLSNQVKRGLANAFLRFDEYQFGKYNRDLEIKLRDVLFLVHPKPLTREQVALFKAIAEDTLETPDTWEVALSTGKDKKATWERLIEERKLGDMALLRNLRNMENAGVARETIQLALLRAKFSRILPFRFIAAARHAVGLEQELDQAMLRAMGSMEKMGGTTGILVDVSGSMSQMLNAKSEITRVDAASALAVLARELSDDCKVAAYSDSMKILPARRGMSLVDAIKNSMKHGNTRTYEAVTELKRLWKGIDRFILITDEQATDAPAYGMKPTLPVVGRKNYVINVAPYAVGLSKGPNYTTINGWSERVLDFIKWDEAQD